MTLAASPGAERRVLLNHISWRLYQDMVREAGAGTRLTFDHGRLEIMSPSLLHDRVKTVLGRLIETYADLLGIDVEGAGSTTFGREDLQKGLEPDECYYVANAAAIAGKEEFDPAVDPPPDLAVEVDISPPQLSRHAIYAALGVPEVWRYDGHRLVFLHRRGEPPEYVVAQTSLSFPALPLEELNQWLQVGVARSQSQALAALREWFRGRLEA